MTVRGKLIQRSHIISDKHHQVTVKWRPVSHLSHQLLLPALLLPPLDLLGRDGLARAGGGVRVVGGPPRSLLRVVVLPPLGAPVLEPDLATKYFKGWKNIFEIRHKRKYFCDTDLF